MKTETEMKEAIIESVAIFAPDVQREEMIERLARLVAALEVFTDTNFTEEEQSRLFNISAQRIKVLKGEE